MTEPWVLYAGIAVWIGIGAYAAFLAANQRRLSRRIFQLELLVRDDSK
ncbi:MAG: CcmD family protein [Desulfovibrionaceae bacterium]|nr:CcmD family protein [Desulfovibrionaceae bacterium]